MAAAFQKGKNDARNVKVSTKAARGAQPEPDLGAGVLASLPNCQDGICCPVHVATFPGLGQLRWGWLFVCMRIMHQRASIFDVLWPIVPAKVANRRMSGLPTCLAISSANGTQVGHVFSGRNEGRRPKNCSWGITSVSEGGRVIWGEGLDYPVGSIKCHLGAGFLSST